MGQTPYVLCHEIARRYWTKTGPYNVGPYIFAITTCMGINIIVPYANVTNTHQIQCNTGRFSVALRCNMTLNKKQRRSQMPNRPPPETVKVETPCPQSYSSGKPPVTIIRQHSFAPRESTTSPCHHRPPEPLSLG